MADLKVQLNGQKDRKFLLKNPIMTASGTYGYADEYENFVNVSNLGAVVTKAISLKPRQGNEGERLFEVEKGLINRIGLENVGIEKFISDKMPVIKAKNISFVMNLAGSSLDEYVETAKTANENDIKAIEINVSCPNVTKGCLEFGVQPESLYELVSEIRKVYEGFLIIKLTPNVSDIESLSTAAEKAGADCISAINTLKGLGVNLEILPDGTVKKSFVQGGLSGKCIKPVALSMVKRIAATVKIPVIGIGGISNLTDILEFFTVGAEAVQIGTENFTNPCITEQLTFELNALIEKMNLKSLDELKRKLRE